MSKQQRIRKLMLGPSEKVTAKNSHVGYVVIADYKSATDMNRYLVFEKPNVQETNEAPAKRTRKTHAAPESIPA